MKLNKLKSGLIVGGGTGKELGDVFEYVSKELAERSGYKTDIVKFEYSPKTYFELRKMNLSPEEVIDIEQKESDDIARFIKDIHKHGYDSTFRTAINAGTLYQLRKKLETIKSMPIKTPEKNILVIRDELQGFYALDDKKEDENEIKFSCSYSKDKTEKIVRAALKEAEKYLKNYNALMTYKYHLFKNFDKWIEEINDKKIFLCQPDTGFKKLTESGNDTLVIASNESGDFLTAVLPKYYGIGNQNTTFSKDISLHPEAEGHEIYQTIHGSADDIAGKGIVNPFATLRATADIIENHGIEIYEKMEEALRKAEREGFVTSDMKGNKKTSEVVDYILRNLG